MYLCRRCISRHRPFPTITSGSTGNHSPELLDIYSILCILHFYYLWFYKKPQPRIIKYLFNIAHFLHSKKTDQNYFLWHYRQPQPRIIRYLFNIVHFLHCKKTDQNYYLWLYRQPQPRIIRYLFNIMQFF